MALADPVESTPPPFVDAGEVATRSFTVTKLREGYDIDGVDEFLDKAARTLRAYDAEEGEVLVTAKDALTVTFTPTRFRNGYDVSEVDDFLDTVVLTLRHWERQPLRLARPVGDGSAAEVRTQGTALGLHETAQRLQQASFLIWGGDALRIAAPDGTQLRVVGMDPTSDGVTLHTAFAPEGSWVAEAVGGNAAEAVGGSATTAAEAATTP